MKNRTNWGATALMAIIMAGALLCLRHTLSGWLLPDGQWLEAVAAKVYAGEETVSWTVFYEIRAWLDDE